METKNTKLPSAIREYNYIKVEVFSGDGRVGKIKVAVEDLHNGPVEKICTNIHGKLVVIFEKDREGATTPVDITEGTIIMMNMTASPTA